MLMGLIHFSESYGQDETFQLPELLVNSNEVRGKEA